MPWLLKPAAVAGEGPEARLALARRARERSRRRWTGIVGLIVVGFLTTAFVRESRLPGKAPAEPLAFAQGRARIPEGALTDHKLHFYAATVPGSTEPVRLFAVQVGDQVRTCFDACEICGDKGYFQDGGTVVCRNCTSPIALGSLGRTGGCNPIPLRHALVDGAVVITAADIEGALGKLKGH